VRYPLNVLLRVRTLRQDKALGALSSAEAHLAEGRRTLREARKRHQEYLLWLAEEEERRYQAIMGCDMTLIDLDEFKLGLRTIRALESGHMERIMKAEKHVDECVEAVAAAKAALLEAQRATLKIEEHKGRWMELAQKEAERKEEAEMEEFSAASPRAALG